MTRNKSADRNTEIMSGSESNTYKWNNNYSKGKSDIFSAEIVNDSKYDE